MSSTVTDLTPAVVLSKTDANLLAALTWVVGPIAAAQIVHATGTVGVTQMSAAELAATSKVPLLVAERVVATRYVGALFIQEMRDTISTPSEVRRALPPELFSSEVELMFAVVLDSRHGVKAVVKLAKGGTSRLTLCAREIFIPLLRLGAVGFVLAHNHPSGDPTPSPEDHDFTATIAAAANVLGLALVDHLIVGGGRIVSFFERGLLPATPEGADNTPDSSTRPRKR
jgi:DNA repair protein RadC